MKKLLLGLLFSLFTIAAYAQVQSLQQFEFGYGNPICGGGFFTITDCTRISGNLFGLFNFGVRYSSGSSVAPLNAGANYVAGEIITLNGGLNVRAAKIAVRSVTNGSITAYNIVDPGEYSVVPKNPVSQNSSSAIGTGALFNLSWAPIAAQLDMSGLLSGGGNTFIGGNITPFSTDVTELAGGQNSGTENTFIGARAGGNATTGSFNTAVGHNAFGIAAGVFNTGSNNTALGDDAMRNAGATTNNNTALGANALRNVTGAGNTAVGLQAFNDLTSATDGVAIGQQAGFHNTGGGNVIIGSKAVNAASSTGGNNVVIGFNSGSAITTGTHNVIIGDETANTTLTTGARNIIFGTASTCDAAAAGTSDTFVLCSSTTSTPLLTGSLVSATLTFTNNGTYTMPNITTDATHTDATVCEDTTSHTFFFGSGAAGICLGTSSIRFKHDVMALNKGLNEILDMKPVEYKLNADKGDPNKPLYGFIAEDNVKILPKLVGYDVEGKVNSFDYMGVVPILVNAIKEQQKQIDELKTKVYAKVNTKVRLAKVH